MAGTQTDVRAATTTRGAEHDQSATGLLSTLASDVSELMRGEMHLARAEISQSVNDAKTGIASLVVGGVVLLTGLIVLLGAIAMALAAFTALAPWSATLLVGLIVTVIGAIMLKTGTSKLSAENLAPTRTQASLEKDKNLVERKVS